MSSLLDKYLKTAVLKMFLYPHGAPEGVARSFWLLWRLIPEVSLHLMIWLLVLWLKTNFPRRRPSRTIFCGMPSSSCWKDLHETGCHPTLCWHFLFKEHNVHSWAELILTLCFVVFFKHLWTYAIIGNARWKSLVLSSSVMKGRECQGSIILGETLPFQPEFKGGPPSFIIMTKNVNWASSVF